MLHMMSQVYIYPSVYDAIHISKSMLSLCILFFLVYNKEHLIYVSQLTIWKGARALAT